MTIAYVQGVADSTLSTASYAVSKTLNGVTAGNLVVLGFSWDDQSSAVPNVVSVTGGGTWQKPTSNQVYNLPHGERTEIWYLENAPGGNLTATVTLFNDGSHPIIPVRISLAEYSGAATSSSIDQAANSTAQTSNNHIVGPTMTPTQNNCLIVAVVQCIRYPPFDTVNYTFRLDDVGASECLVFDTIQTTAAASTFDATFSTSATNTSCLCAVFRAAAAAGPVLTKGDINYRGIKRKLQRRRVSYGYQRGLLVPNREIIRPGVSDAPLSFHQ